MPVLLLSFFSLHAQPVVSTKSLRGGWRFEFRQQLHRACHAPHRHRPQELAVRRQRARRTPVGDPIALFIVGDGIGEDVTRTDTGEILSNGRDIDRNIFNFEADIVYELEAGKSYWVSIHAILSDQVADDARFFQLGLLADDPDIVDQSAQLTGGFNNQGEFNEFWQPSNRWDISLRP